jgi:MFS superfamily sulfate permease-like transporter
MNMGNLKETLPKDLLASVVVFLVALPLCMGIAIASGMPPAAGLVTGIVGGIIVGFFAGSPLQVSGPAAGLAVIVWEIVRDHGVSALGPILMIAGLLQLFAGFARVGQWFRAISPAVVYGMLAGIGVLIFASQFHSMVDDKPRGSGLENLLSIPAAIMKGIFPVDGSAHHIAAVLGILTIGIIILWNKFRPDALKSIPGALLAVTTATVIASLMKLPVQYVNVPENLLADLQRPGLDSAGMFITPAILLTAFAVAFVASAETLLSAAAVDRMHRGVRTKFDKELCAQGVGNFICGILGALPMTGVIVRSSANVQAGAVTRASAILHGAWLLAFVLAAPWILRAVPIASLAALLVFTGYKLVDLKNVKQLQKYGWMPVGIYVATVVGIVVTDLLTGVLIGVGLSLLKTLYKVTFLSVGMTHTPEELRSDLYLEGSATFLRLPLIARALDSVPAGHTLHVHGDHLAYIDHTCLDLMYSWAEQHRATGGALVVEWDSLQHRFEKPVALGYFHRARVKKMNGGTQFAEPPVSEAVAGAKR